MILASGDGVFRVMGSVSFLAKNGSWLLGQKVQFLSPLTRAPPSSCLQVLTWLLANCKQDV